MIHPSPIVRARAVGLDEKQPEWIAIPALIARLNDPDPVVRIVANDGLKERTKRDFAFYPWASPEDRAPAIARWKTWWDERRAQAGYPKDDSLRKVSTRPNRRRRNGNADDQGGTNSSWPATSPPTPVQALAAPQPQPQPLQLP
jgi:hypothetical protein